jgi:vesicle-associated membrane protein 7
MISYVFHYLVEEGITFLCLTEGNLDRRIAFAFLFETKERFFSRYSVNEIPSGAFAVNNEFSKVLANQMEYFSHSPAADKINQVKEKLERTKHQMNQNIGNFCAMF